MKRLFLILFVFSQSLWAQQVRFEASTDRTTYALNENIELAFTMNVDADNFELPALNDFRVQGPFISIAKYDINGRISFQKRYKYYLVPKRKGVFVIKESQIEFNGKIYKSNILKIKIVDEIKQQNNPFQNGGTIRVEDNLFLVADVSKANPYVNEPMTIVYKLYFSYNIGIINWQDLNKPKYRDFWSQNIDVNQIPGEELFRGERFRYLVIKKVVLYPQKAGNLQIEPITLDVDLEVPTGREDRFGNYEVRNQTKRVSAGSKVINVKPLPEAGKPASFSGAVGKFNFSVLPTKTTLKSGESLDLDIKVTGVGNLKLFNLPKPVVPSELEMYDPEHSENVSTPLSGMTGSISDRYTIIPQSKGNFPIKGLEFSYFDLSTKSYKTITSPNIMLNVLDGPGLVSSNPNTTVASKSVVAPSKSFAFIKQKTNLENIESEDFLGSGLFYGLLFLPFLLIPVLIIFKKRKENQDADIVGNRTKRSNALAKKYLSEAKKQINNKEPFYIALEKAMHNFLKAKLNIETSEMSKDKITEILLSRNANSETVKEFITLTESCELARYALSTSTIIHQDYDKAVEIISSLEKQIK